MRLMAAKKKQSVEENRKYKGADVHGCKPKPTIRELLMLQTLLVIKAHVNQQPQKRLICMNTKLQTADD